MWKNVAGRYEMNGKKIYAKEILKNPTQYFTDDIMKELDSIAQKQFSYGSDWNYNTSKLNIQWRIFS